MQQINFQIFFFSNINFTYVICVIFINKHISSTYHPPIYQYNRKQIVTTLKKEE